VTFALTAVLASETPAPEAPAATWPVRVWARLVDPVSGQPAPALAAAMLEATKKRGLLIGKGGLYGHTLRMAPPLTLTLDEAREGLAILIDALQEVSA